MQLRYSFRLDPGPGQRVALARAFGCARLVYNDALRACKDAYAAGQRKPSAAWLQKSLITEAKKRPERAFLAEVSNIVLQQSVRDLEAGYASFFASITGRRKGPKVKEPRFKSRRDRRQAIRLHRGGFSVRANGRLFLAKVGEVPVAWSRALPSEPSSVTIIKDAAGRYFASFVVETDPDEDRGRFPVVDAEVGIDLGLASFAVLSDGTVIDNPCVLRRAERTLKKAQQAVARKQKGSNNRRKAVAKLARAHAKVAEARRDFHHKASTAIVRENQAVYVEDLAVAGLGRTRLAKSVHDAGWSGFTGMLEYKCRRYGRAFARIDRFAPTSQTCSACGVKDGPKPLSVREWTCTTCGAAHDRDLNAARNILVLGRQVAAGQAETLNACGAQVRPGAIPAQRDEAGTRRSDQTRTGVAQ